MELLPSIGFVPNSAPLVLSEGADFIHEVVLTNGAMFPAGTRVWIQWKNAGNSQWEASVTGGTAAWNVQSANTGAAVIPNGTKYSLYVSYPDGVQTNDFLWYSGWSRRMD